MLAFYRMLFKAVSEFGAQPESWFDEKSSCLAYAADRKQLEHKTMDSVKVVRITYERRHDKTCDSHHCKTFETSRKTP